jgi:hypothetical protein
LEASLEIGYFWEIFRVGPLFTTHFIILASQKKADPVAADLKNKIESEQAGT